MTKKILSTVAAAAVLATGAMAYEVSELSTTYFNRAWDYNNSADKLKLVDELTDGTDAMIFPAFFAGGGFETNIRVVNTSDKYATVVKIVFFEKDTSEEIKDFNIYLSANDVWTGKVVEEGGKYYIVSSDDSAPLAKIDNSMASESEPLKEEIPANAGYFEVLKSVVVDNKYHEAHKDLRIAYKSWANIARTGNTNAPALVGNGIFQNVKIPDINTTAVNNGAFDTATATAKAESDSNVSVMDSRAALYGEVKLVNTTNKTAMTIQPVYFQYPGENEGLVYLEGEKANLMDILIDGNSTNLLGYMDDNDSSRLGLKDINNTLITFDDEDAMTNGNMVLMTAPFKRVLVQREGFGANTLDGTVNINSGNKLYSGVTTDATGTVTNYGEYKAFANIYNNSETKFNTITFSPALPSYLVFTKEVQSTESIKTPLSSYVAKAIEADATFAKGGYIVIDFEAAGYDVFAIPTWMQGTYVNGQAVTNWRYPATNIKTGD